MLSEKAKGKQRAIDPELDGEPSQTDSRNLTIRFTEGIPDLVLFLTGTDTVRDVKAKVCGPFKETKRISERDTR